MIELRLSLMDPKKRRRGGDDDNTIAFLERGERTKPLWGKGEREIREGGRLVLVAPPGGGKRRKKRTRFS